MSLHKNVARNWSMSLVLLMAPLAWADNKPRSSPPPKPAAAPRAAPAAHPPANANTRTLPSQHPASTAPGIKYGSPTTSHPGSTGTHTGSTGATHTGSTGATHTGSAGATHTGSTGATHTGSTGATHTGRTGPPTTRTFSNGTTAKVSPGGRVQSIHTANGVTINRTVSGRRTIVTERNGRTLVSTGPHSGYMQRSYLNRNGREYVQRTYVVGGRTNVYVYNRYSYRGAFYYGYVPGYYYRPVFYGWVYNPWVNPVYYRWDWRGAAWYAPYGYYFAPAPYYPVASLWLTDYLLAESLRAAYDAGAASAAQQPGPSGPPLDQPAAQNTVLTPEIKQAIAEEVKRQIDAERAAAAAPAAAPVAAPAAAPAATLVAEQRPAALDPAVSVFVVSSNLDVNAGEQACSLSPGDVIMRIDDTPDAKQNVSVKVASSKRSDCPAGQKVAVAVQDLQEMHNQFRAKIDSGLKMLAENQGKDGLPPAPDAQTSPGEVPPPAPDAVRVELQRVQAEADQTEADVKKQVSSTGRS